MNAQSGRARSRQEYVIGVAVEFPEGTHRVVQVGNREIGVFRIKGQFYALPNLCPHQTGPLCEGKTLTGTTTARAETGWKVEWVREGEIITCPWHGLQYHVPTGQCLAFPEITLRRYEVLEESGNVSVRI
jgi:nitrite reductase/ring-hydroxylating ferredoxin subunit